MAFKLGMAVDLCMENMLMLNWMTLPLMQSYSGSAEKNNIQGMAEFKLRMSGRFMHAYFRFDDLDSENVCKAHPLVSINSIKGSVLLCT